MGLMMQRGVLFLQQLFFLGLGKQFCQLSRPINVWDVLNIVGWACYGVLLSVQLRVQVSIVQRSQFLHDIETMALHIVQARLQACNYFIKRWIDIWINDNLISRGISLNLFHISHVILGQENLIFVLIYKFVLFSLHRDKQVSRIRFHCVFY